MRHIDDGYSYEFYEYTQDVLDYYLKKSDYDSYSDEDKYRETRLMVIDDGYKNCYDLESYYGSDEKYGFNILDEEDENDGIYGGEDDRAFSECTEEDSCSEEVVTFSCGIF